MTIGLLTLKLLNSWTPELPDHGQVSPCADHEWVLSLASSCLAACYLERTVLCSGGFQAHGRKSRRPPILRIQRI
jgi:hypothetical protein